MAREDPGAESRQGAPGPRLYRPAAVMNAITDALGVKDLPMPATAHTVWQALQKKAA